LGGPESCPLCCADWKYTAGQPARALTRDEMLDDITLYWITNTGISSARLY
jgi:microsomal epoxide hydrolase